MLWPGCFEVVKVADVFESVLEVLLLLEHPKSNEQHNAREIKVTVLFINSPRNEFETTVFPASPSQQR